MATATTAPSQSSPAEARSRIVEALTRLAGKRRFEEISIRDICAEADVSLADFRDLFPSKGAVLAGLSRRLDREVLSAQPRALEGETARDRLFDVLMRRLDAMAPYREGLREVYSWLRRDLAAALEMNRVVVNSMRFMLEAAGVDAQGLAAPIKLQGLAFAWARVVAVWLDDEEPGLARTMAALDAELRRGEGAIANVERLERVAEPIAAFARAALNSRPRSRDFFRGRRHERSEDDDPTAEI